LAGLLTWHTIVQVLNGFAYYFGLIAIPDDQVVYELMGVPTYILHRFVDVSSVGFCGLFFFGFHPNMPGSTADAMEAKRSAWFVGWEWRVSDRRVGASVVSEPAHDGILHHLIHHCPEVCWLCCVVAGTYHGRCSEGRKQQ